MSVTSEYCANCTSNSTNLFGGSSSFTSSQVGVGEEGLGSDTNQISSELGYGFQLGDDIGKLNPFCWLRIF